MITGKILGNRYVLNGLSADVPGKVPDMSADIYYEVIRLIDGKLLFLKDHLDRLQQSISGTGIEFPGHQQIIESLGLLIHENPFREGNIRISLQQDPYSKSLLKCYFIPYFYPDPEMYKSGVKLAIYPHVRPHPGIKKWDDQFRTSVSRFIQQQKVYEAVLINSQNQITEGSRSNIFYIDRNNRLITVPSKNILPGITRKYVMQLAREQELDILEKTITVEELGSLVSVFISGTSPKVLPVKQIETHYFNTGHPILHLLMDRFEYLVQNSLTLV